MPEWIDNAARDGITRRDFLDGVAISAAGLAAAAAAPHLTGAEAAELARARRSLPPGHYPPTDTGLLGHTDQVVRRTMRIDGPPNPDHVHSTRGGPGINRDVRDTGEVYDCVIVGAGASGLAAAKFYRDRFGPEARILVLDPLEDFGGHSHRNEFHIPGSGNADVMILRNGGTVNLDSIGTWDEPSGAFLDVPPNQPALDLLDFCEVDPDNFPSTSGPGIPSSFGLRSMLLFPSADWGSRHTHPEQAQQRVVGDLPGTHTVFAGGAGGDHPDPDRRDHRLDRAAARADEPRAQAQPAHPDHPEPVLDALCGRARGGNHPVPAQRARPARGRRAGDLGGRRWMLGQPGFDGVVLPDPVEVADNGFPGIGRTPQMGFQTDTDPTVLWPDGNSSLLRLLVSKLIPGSFADLDGAPPNQENIVLARCDYSKLDRRQNDVRIRLRSFVFNVDPASHHKHDHGLAKVDYLDCGSGKGRRVRGKHVIMACWNRVAAHIVEGLPRRQVENLCYARKVPLIYGRAGLRNWQAFADARISSVSPRGNSLFWDTTSLQMGAVFGSVYGPTRTRPISRRR